MNIKQILTLSRPRFWPYLAIPYLIGYTVASTSKSDFFTFPFIYTLFYFLLPANFFLYAINDYFDRPSRAEATEVLNFVLLSLIFTLPLFAYLHRYSLAILFLFLVLAAFYSAPPIRFKTLPFLDSISNILYLLPGFIGFTQFRPPSASITALLCLACWPIAMHLFSTISPIESDRRAGITTTAAYIGRNQSLIVCIVLWLIFALYATSINPFFVVSFIYPSLPLYLLYHDEIKVERIYGNVPLLNAVLGIALFLYLLYIRFYL